MNLNLLMSKSELMNEEVFFFFFTFICERNFADANTCVKVFSTIESYIIGMLEFFF